MRNFTYRLMFVLVAISVIFDAVVWLMFKVGVPKAYLLLATPLSFFATPITNIIVAFFPALSFLVSNPVSFTIKTIMLVLVVRRLILFIKARNFATSAANFFLGSYVMASIGLVALTIAIAILFIAFSPAGKETMFFRYVSLPFLLLAQFFVPLAFLVNELWSLRGNKAVLS